MVKNDSKSVQTSLFKTQKEYVFDRNVRLSSLSDVIFQILRKKMVTNGSKSFQPSLCPTQKEYIFNRYVRLSEVIFQILRKKHGEKRFEKRSNQSGYNPKRMHF